MTLKNLTSVDSLCSQLQKVLSLTPTIINLACSPEKFIPALHYMIEQLEEEKSKCEDQTKVPRLFSMFPNPSFKWRHITLNGKALATLTNQRSPVSYADNIKIFYNLFDLSKLGYHT
jgi:hypothetical protein